MRRVEFWQPNFNSCSGTLVRRIGYFHQWGVGYHVYVHGTTVNYTFAIVEDETGKIWKIEPDEIKFIDTVEIPASDSITAINTKPNE